jgi:hypothetical protein
MMEARDVYVGGQKFREAVSRGTNSNGFKFYLADHPDDERAFNTGNQELAYRHFLDWLGSLLSEEIGVLFSPADPANRLYPRQKTLEKLLALLNDGELSEVWEQDETIGWVYQYFTPKELRDQLNDYVGRFEREFAAWRGNPTFETGMYLRERALELADKLQRTYWKRRRRRNRS